MWETHSKIVVSDLPTVYASNTTLNTFWIKTVECEDLLTDRIFSCERGEKELGEVELESEHSRFKSLRRDKQDEATTKEPFKDSPEKERLRTSSKRFLLQMKQQVTVTGPRKCTFLWISGPIKDTGCLVLSPTRPLSFLSHVWLYRKEERSFYGTRRRELWNYLWVVSDVTIPSMIFDESCLNSELYWLVVSHWDFTFPRSIKDTGYQESGGLCIFRGPANRII